MTRPKILDLFCCAGGAAKGYHDAGWDVYGVDKDARPRYPYAFHQGDALHVMLTLLAGGAVPFTHKDGTVEWLRLRDFDAIHASPPCQFATAYRRKGQGVGAGALNLIPDVRATVVAASLPYVIENVESARGHLRRPIRLCGSMFGLDVQRHRLFETDLPLTPASCDHSIWTPRFPPATNRTNLRRTVEVGVWRIPLDVQQRAMGIDWMALPELSQAIPPAYTEWIGTQILAHVAASRAA